MKHNAFRTHHINQERIRVMRGRKHLGTKVAVGNRFVEMPSGNSVIYCANCHAPVVDSVEAKGRHARRGALCLQAMNG